METLNSSYSHLYLYTHENILFVWSKETASLYTFSHYYGALFFFMEENNTIDMATQFTLSMGLDNNQETQKVIAIIHTILNNTEKKTPYKEEPLKIVPALTSDTSSYNHYALYNSFFSLYLVPSVQNYINPSFEHLLCQTNCTTSQYHFDVLYENGVYNIYTNNVFQASVEKKENILAVLQDYIRIIFYENSNFLVAMHAATLAYKNKTFIFPGVSGAGKSTLSSFLMNRGFTLYSDEVTVVDSSYTINSLALCNTIKENSWEAVKTFDKGIDALATHKRFDGQHTKFLKPPNTSQHPIHALGAYIFFPTYKQGAKTQLKAINIVEAIALITQAQYHLYNPKDAEVTKSFLIFLTSCKLYTISYSNLESAKKAIEGVINND